jgi:transposase
MRHASPRFGGLDVHQDSIAVAYAREAWDTEGIFMGRSGPRQGDMAKRSRTRSSNAKQPGFVDEAGPCGYWLYRYLTQKDLRGGGVAPALGPKNAGDRANTDRREAIQLARLRRSGALTPVYVPAAEGEAIRDRTRARGEASGISRPRSTA